MTTKLDARVVNQGNGLTASSQNLAVNIGSDMAFNGTALAISRTGFSVFSVTPGVSSFSIPLDSNFDEFDITIDKLLPSVAATVALGFNFGSGLNTANTAQRNIACYSTSTVDGARSTGLGIGSIGTISITDGLSAFINIVNPTSGRKTFKAQFMYSNAVGTDNTHLSIGHDDNSLSAKATSVTITVSSGTFKGGTISVKPKMK